MRAASTRRLPLPRVARGRSWLSLGLGLLGLVPGGQARGQVSVDRLEMVLKAVPGQSGLGVLNVHNTGNAAVQVSAHLEDWDRDEDGVNRWYPVGGVQGSCGDRIQIFPTSLSLDPGTSQAVRVTLDSVAGLRRECWTAVVVQTVRPPVGAGTSVTQVIRTATKIYVQPPSVEPHGVVFSMEVIAPEEGSDDPPQVDVVFENSGDAHFVAHGEVQVRTPDNGVMEKVELPPAYLLPGARGRVRAALPQLSPGRYVLLAVVDYGGAELAAGQIEYRVR